MNTRQEQMNPNLSNLLEILRIIGDTDFEELRAHIIRRSEEVGQAGSEAAKELLPAVDKFAAFKREIEG